MPLTRFRLALVLATLSAGLSTAHASDCLTGLNNQCYPTFVQVDPTTGRPTTSAVNPYPGSDYAKDRSDFPDAKSGTALGAPGDTPATASGSNGSISALLKAIRDKQISGQTVTDAQNAPYGLSGAVQGATLTPGNTTPVTPGRNIHIFCAPTTSPATGYTTLTEANGETHQVQLAAGAQYDFPWAVTLVAAQTTVTGTLAACEFKDMN